MKQRLEALNYPLQEFTNNYYTAMPRPGIGVCVAYMVDGFMVQLFPWKTNEPGHTQYAKFIVAKATMDDAASGELFSKWPFLHFKGDDTLMLKCLIEDTLNKLEQHDDPDQRGGTDPTAD